MPSNADSYFIEYLTAVNAFQLLTASSIWQPITFVHPDNSSFREQSCPELSLQLT